MSGGDNEFAVTKEDEVEVTCYFHGFTKPILAQSFLDDESGIDEATIPTPITKREYQLMNMKLNVLVRPTYSCFSSNFQHMMTVHESAVKTIFSQSKRLFDAQEKLVSDTTTKVDVSLSKTTKALSKMDIVLSEVQTLKVSTVYENTVHHHTITGEMNDLVGHCDIEEKIAGIIAEKENKIKSIRLELR